MTQTSTPTACVIIIGNEILSGRTEDMNLPYLGKALAARGIPVREAHVIPDIEDIIIKTVNDCRARFTYVFTSGGIGPTHDDITASCIAKAFGVEFDYDPEAKRMLEDYFGERTNEVRLRMAKMPVGAAHIPNPVSVAPGFRMENVYVMAGVPRIMQGMFDSIAHTLDGGEPVLSRAVSADGREGDIAIPLENIQNTFPDVDLGSYPFGQGGRIGVCIVGRSTLQDRLDLAMEHVAEMFHAMGLETSDIDPTKKV